jgi:hypothetical protein
MLNSLGYVQNKVPCQAGGLTLQISSNEENEEMPIEDSLIGGLILLIPLDRDV